MRSIKKAFLTALLLIAIYGVSFGPIWGWYTAHNSPTPDSIKIFYSPILAGFDNRYISIPLVAYLYIWERIYGRH
jgi:uncharacterized membrane protein YpjA